jgi:hypothetical protein
MHDVIICVAGQGSCIAMAKRCPKACMSTTSLCFTGDASDQSASRYCKRLVPTSSRQGQPHDDSLTSKSPRSLVPYCIAPGWLAATVSNSHQILIVKERSGPAAALDNWNLLAGLLNDAKHQCGSGVAMA